MTNIYFELKMQLSVPKESDIGFTITELQNEVIAIDKIYVRHVSFTQFSFAGNFR